MNGDLEQRISELEKKQTQMQQSYLALKASMDNNTNALQEFIELGKNLKFGIKVLGVIESTAVWITKVSLAIATLWAIWKFVIIETIKQART